MKLSYSLAIHADTVHLGRRRLQHDEVIELYGDGHTERPVAA